ncbi:hypothetical protein AB3Z09_05730 [Companilactobacillus farciminis]|uniref:hypothetical protein n=1 Tax=Companilactobacillus farciminis TaxID=1612 RepID=UPI0034D55FB6
MNKKIAHIIVFFIFSLPIIVIFNTQQIIDAAENKDFEQALKTAPKGLHWDNASFSIADFKQAAINRYGKAPSPDDSLNLTNNAKIFDVDPTDPESTSVIEMTNAGHQTGAVWSNMNNENYFDISKDQIASMWLYLGTINHNEPGDGMAFVLQNDKNKNNSIALTADGIPVNGESLGVWGADWIHNDDNQDRLTKAITSSAIQNSWALEFDTFIDKEEANSSTKEGRSFDYDPFKTLEKHIAGGYPALKDTYKFVSYYPHYFTMNHTNYQAVPDLAGTITKEKDGTISDVINRWRHVTISWSHENNQLTYAYNDKDPNTSKPITGSQRITSTFNIDPKNFGLTDGNTKLYWGFTGSTGNYSENNLLIFESIPSYVDAQATTSIYNDSTSTAVPDGSSVDALDDLTYNYTLTYKGWNKTWSQIKAKMKIPKNITFTSGEVIYSNGDKEELPTEIFKNATDSIDYQLKETLKTGNNSAIIQLHGHANAPSNNLKTTVPSAHAHFAGDNLITDTDTDSFTIIPRTITLNSETSNPIEINKNQDVDIPAKISFHGSNSITPDLSKLSVYQKLNNQSMPTKVNTTINSNGEFVLHLDKSQLNQFSTTISFYAKDDTNTTKNLGETNTISRTIQIGGSVFFSEISNNVSFSPINSVNDKQLITRSGDWHVKVTDTREKGSSWIVYAKASKLIDNSKHYLNGDIVYRSDSNDILHDLQESTNIAQHIKQDDNDQNTDITLWTPQNGILLETNSENNSGLYKGTISWSLIDSIDQKK